MPQFSDVADLAFLHQKIYIIKKINLQSDCIKKIIFISEGLSFSPTEISLLQKEKLLHVKMLT